MHPFFHSSPFFPFFSGQLFLCCLLEGGVWRMGPFLPNCRFEGFFSLVHATLRQELFGLTILSVFYLVHNGFKLSYMAQLEMILTK